MRVSPRAFIAALAVLGVLAFATGAQADPGTVTGPNGLSLSVDDTTPAPGQTITFAFTYTVPSNGGGNNNAIGFGGEQVGSGVAQNLADLTYVSCDGDLLFCRFTPATSEFAFASNATGTRGQRLAGSAQFTVSSGATNGEHISMFGNQLTSENGPHDTDSSLTLTVTVPGADLGVGLTASSAPLSGAIGYDVAVTNNGPSAASSATIVTQLPTQATSITPTGACTYNSADDKVTCSVGSLANGATGHVPFTVQFGLLTIGPGLTATATRTASSPTDPNAANDSASVSCTAVTSLLITG